MAGEIVWECLIDWDGDGVLETDEAARMVHPFHCERGRLDEFEDLKAGKATITLRNHDGRFSPRNASGPLYGNLKPFRRCQVRATVAGTTYNVLTGRIGDIQELGGKHGGKRAKVTVLDGLAYLQANECSVALQENKRIDELVGAVLDAVGWPAAERDLQQANTTLGYFWSPKQSALSIIRKLVESECGLCYIAGNGTFTFRNRTTAITASSVGNLDEAVAGDIAIDAQPWDSIYNEVRVTCYPVALAPTAAIWQLQGTAKALGPGESWTVWAEFVDANGQPCAARDVLAPAAGTDYTANAAADGSGADRTASLSVVASAFSTSAKLALANSGAATLYVTRLQIQGQAITVYPTTIVREDTASQDPDSGYGKRTLALDLTWLQNAEEATDLANALLAFYRSPRPGITWPMEQRLPELLGHELLGRLTITAGEYGIDEMMRLGHITLDTTQTMQGLRGELHFEPCNTTTFWLRGVAGNSERGLTTRYGY